MNSIRSILILVLLCTYPLYSYAATFLLDVNPNYLTGLIAFLLLFEVLFTKYRLKENLIIPPYLVIFGLFTLYVFGSSILISNRFAEVSFIKYVYEDPFLKSLAFIFVVENTRFQESHLNLALRFLFIVLIAAALVTLWQVYDPLFFNADVIKGMHPTSFERYTDYVSNLGPGYDHGLDFIKEGYRTSIYSWISGVSVGIDGLAIFSILLGIHRFSPLKRIIIIICGGFISILSSARWIMLNFLVISFQRLIDKRNPLFYAIRWVLGLALTIVLVGFIASIAGFDVAAFIEKRLLAESAGTRIYAFKVFHQVFLDAPVFGTGGADSKEMLRLIQGKTSQIHVGWLKMFYYYGIVGGLLYLGFIGLLLKHLYSRALKTKYWGAFFAVLAFVIANITLYELSFLYHGLLLALIFARYLSNVPPPEKQVVETTPLKPVIRRTITPRRRHTVEV